jgi:hypothetical protein
LGHATIKQTVDTYGKSLQAEHHAQSTAKLDQVFGITL